MSEHVEGAHTRVTDRAHAGTAGAEAEPGVGEPIVTDCVVVGGGPAGLMLGLLLARQGVQTVVLEQHGDFLRDFRGDTIHPSTQELLIELGLLDRFLARPHADMPEVTMEFSGEHLVVADFTRLPTRRRTITFMPQWDFLALLAEAGREYEGFDLRMRTRGGELLLEGDRVVGVRADGPDGPLDIRARLTVLADGRESRLRAAAGLETAGETSAIDVLWFRVPRTAQERITFMQLGDGALLSIDRGDFYQCAHIVRKGAWDGSDEAMAGLRHRVVELEPAFRDRVAELGVDDVRVLDVRIDRLDTWYRDGLLAIGDAAHAMSPAGGVGVNLAIQDAAATARILGPGPWPGRPSTALLRRVQRTRELPAIVTQAIQRRIETVLVQVVEPGADASVPIPLRVLQRVPLLRHLTGRFVGLGFRRERRVLAARSSAKQGARTGNGAADAAAGYGEQRTTPPAP